MEATEHRGSGQGQHAWPGNAGGKARRLLARYEVVIATVAVIVLITRVTGGAFTIDRLGVPGETPGRSPLASQTGSRGGAPSPYSPPPAASGARSVTPFTPATPAPPAGGGVAGAPASPDQARISTPEPAPSSVAPPAPAEKLGDSFAFAAVGEPGAPGAIAVASSGAVWVGTDNGPEQGADGRPKLFRFGPDGTLEASYEPDGVERGITAIVASAAGPLYLLARDPAAVFRFTPETGTVARYASIPDVRPCVPPVVAADCDAAVVDQPPTPTAMAFDDVGNLFVADAAQGAIWRVPAGGGEAEQWLVQVGWANPARPSGPTGLAFDGAGNLVVAVQALLADDVGVVYLVNVTNDGEATEPVELARTEAGARPAGVALGMSGTIFVPLRGAGVVLVLSPKGEEMGRTPEGETVDTPAGIAFRGTDVLVTAQAPSDPTAGRVVRLPVGEEGGLVRDDTGGAP